MLGYAPVLATLLAAVNAQLGAPNPNCTVVEKLVPNPGPFYMFEPGKADCGAGWAVPFGPVPPGCAKLEVLVARGTSESGPIGQIVGDPLVARVIRDMKKLNETAQGYPVQASHVDPSKQYPADMLNFITGVTDVSKRITAQIQACPDIKFALVGYSQGGSVMSTAQLMLSAEQKEKIIAVVLYGSGDGTTILDPLKDRTIANCAVGDFACGDLQQGPGHTSYNERGTIWHDRSSQYIVQQLHGKALGRKIMKTPNDPL
ncbi:alpha/beta-hydrolase [Microthyrium microscopicum]|uniref:Alpha/beta-hydrolase n=1 Tax=Microthyrium microscopicum TaxID=703497 RepID=A0A6A6UFK4_9PEZI|nr:alpha/beta-hydrolase [Microthyrium microscopicum]